MSRLAIIVALTLALPFLTQLRALTVEGDVLVVTEHVKNRSFERDSDGDGIPDHWRPHNLGSEDGLVPDPFHGDYSFKIVGEQGVNKYLRQTIRMRIPSGTRLELTGHSKSEGASRGGVGGPYKIKIVFFFDDGTSQALSIPFHRGTHDWERTGAGGLRFPKDIVKTTFSVVYHRQSGTAWFDLTHFGTGEPE